MILYIEKSIKNNEETKRIIAKFNNPSIIYINNYKNLFDKNLAKLKSTKSIIIAELKGSAINEIPQNYGHNDLWFFFKTSLNCVFDCSYCYLKWAFKNDNIVIFINYDDIKEEIKNKINCLKNEKEIWFYSSDYSDILWMDNLTEFIKNFVPFFEKFENTFMEIRTKSANIKSLLDLGFVPKNTEIAFSLNPQELIDKYEKWSSSLDDRIKSINILLWLWFKVWLRFLPLLPVKNYEVIYRDFIVYIKDNIDMEKLYSTFTTGLLFTKKDYNKILGKYPKLDILHMLNLDEDDFYRESNSVRKKFYEMFRELDPNIKLCLDE